MNQRPPTTEESLATFLKPATEAGLSDTERSLMKSELMAYAAFHTPLPTAASRAEARSFSLWVRAGVAFLAVFMVSGGVGYLSTESVPGDPLYSVKVNVIEPVVSLSHMSEIGQLEYQVALMERRLSEVQSLAAASELGPDEVAIVEAELNDRVTAVTAILDADTDASIPDAVALDVASQVHALAEAHGELTDGHSTSTEDASFEDIIDKTADRYVAEAETFASSAPPEEVGAYVSEVLIDIELALGENGDLASSSVAELRAELEAAAEALEREELDEALLRAGAAQHLVTVDGYVDGDTTRDERVLEEDAQEITE